MNLEDIKSLSDKTREDGKRLFGVCDFIYKVAIIGIWFVGIVGSIAAIFAIFNANVWVGIGVAVVVLSTCFINYVIAVLTTHIAKVLVHTSFSNLAILEHINKLNIDSNSQ